MADTTAYKCTALTGGAAGALDAIDGALLLDGDFAFVMVGNLNYTYLLDVDSGSAESSPTIISPDVNAGTKRWVLQGSNVVVGSDADGDMYYRASSVLARLAKGAANLKMFMNAGATAPEWATGVKIITFTRNIAAADGDVAYTGVGFKPSCVIFMAIVNGTTKHSIGYDALSNGLGVLIAYGAASSWINDAAKSITLHDGSAANQYGNIKTFDADGFTITYGHDGSPTGIATIYALCFR